MILTQLNALKMMGSWNKRAAMHSLMQVAIPCMVIRFRSYGLRRRADALKRASLLATEDAPVRPFLFYCVVYGASGEIIDYGQVHKIHADSDGQI